MLTDWINVTRVKLSGAERLYPKDIDWVLTPGVNAIIGGTALGKTTFVYALQFGIFGKMVSDTRERIEREFFKGRLTDRSSEEIQNAPPIIEVQFKAGGSFFTVKRNLIDGGLVEASCDQLPLKSSKYYETIIAEKVGMKNDFHSLRQLQSYLLFLGESRFLLAWENLLQNKILNLIFSDHAIYANLNELWDKAKSADSQARNISAQVSRMESDFKKFSSTTSNVQELERREKLNELKTSIDICVAQIARIKKELTNEEKLLSSQEADIDIAYTEFHKALDRFEIEVSDDLDDELLSAALTTPTSASVRHALEQFYLKPNSRTCPCCGRPGLSGTVAQLAKTLAESAKTGHCIICSKDLPAAHSPKAVRPPSDQATAKKAENLQGLIFKREQTKSRIENLLQEESSAIKASDEARAAEAQFLHDNPQSATNPFRVAIKQWHARENFAKKESQEFYALLQKELEVSNEIFEGIQAKIAKAFTKYATLYLDEACDVKFLKKDELPSKRGPQIKAPHSAFFPVISGQKRSSAQALSDAQRSFVDLAFRMAILDVWHQQKGKTVTMIVETPEGAVDFAYMDRVATMLRTFANQGHTLIITTNMNNEIFLPKIMAAHPKAERMDRMLNLLKLGRPRKVQKNCMVQFNEIIESVQKQPEIVK